MQKLTHSDLINKGLTFSDDGEEILMFDMSEYKKGINMRCLHVANSKDIKKEFLYLFMSSMQLYQAVFRSQLYANEIKELLNKIEVVMSHPRSVESSTAVRMLKISVSNKLNELRDIMQLSQMIAIDGADAVAARMEANALEAQKEAHDAIARLSKSK